VRGERSRAREREEGSEGERRRGRERRKTCFCSSLPSAMLPIVFTAGSWTATELCLWRGRVEKGEGKGGEREGERGGEGVLIKLLSLAYGSYLVPLSSPISRPATSSSPSPLSPLPSPSSLSYNKRSTILLAIWLSAMHSWICAMCHSDACDVCSSDGVN
jgi:hypothetical protein